MACGHLRHLRCEAQSCVTKGGRDEVFHGIHEWEEARKKETKGSSEEGRMCPACIASAAAVVAGAGSTGGILAVCIGKFRGFLRANRLGLFQQTKEK